LDKSPVSKLFKLKEWLTLPEAAKHLTGVCNEEITEADILRLALDRHLRLSVYFVNKAYVRPGQVVGYEDVKWGEFPAEMTVNMKKLPVEARGKPLPYIRSLQINDDKYLNLEEKVVVIEGVWDLPMIGNEQLDIEHQYQQLIYGASVELIGLDGALVEGNNGVMCQLQDDLGDYHGHRAARRAQFDKLRRLELNKRNNRRKEKLLILRKEKLEKLKQIEDDWYDYGRFYPADGLPEDCVLVVRTNALREFERLIADNEQEINTAIYNIPNKSDLPESERNTMLKLIIGMAINAYGYNPESNRNSATGDKNGISAKLQTHGISIIDDTIRKYLTEAKKLI